MDGWICDFYSSKIWGRYNQSQPNQLPNIIMQVKVDLFPFNVCNVKEDCRYHVTTFWDVFKH